MYKFGVNPVPKVRMTQKSVWTKQAQKCLVYQQEIACNCKNNKIDFGKKLVGIQIKFIKNGRICDLDNLIKSFIDGLQLGGAVENDTQFREINATVVYEKNTEGGIIFNIYEL